MNEEECQRLFANPESPISNSFHSTFIKNGTEQVVDRGKVIGQHHLVGIGKNFAHLSTCEPLTLWRSFQTGKRRSAPVATCLSEIGQVELSLRRNDYERVAPGVRQVDLAAEDVHIREDIRDGVDIAAKKSACSLLVGFVVKFLDCFSETRLVVGQLEQPFAQLVGHDTSNR